MSTTYSVIMMLLLLAASLVGIGSIYKPADVEAQPQAQQPGTQGLMTRDQQKSLNQAMSDTQLLDRLMPLIINRLDSKMLAQKILPYLDLNVVLTQRPGESGSLKVGTLGIGGAAWGKASCAPGETAVSAGFTHQAQGDPSVFTVRRNDPNSNAWDITTSFDDTGKVFTFAECLTVELGFKDVQQPQGLGPGGLLNLRK